MASLHFSRAVTWLQSCFPEHLNQSASNSWTKYLAVSAGVTAAVAGGKFAWNLYRDRKLPPGPWALPFVGSIHKVKESTLDDDLLKLAEEYGDVFSVKLGKTLYIILASHSAIKEAFVRQGDVFACRPTANRAVVDYMHLDDDIFATPYQTEGWNQNKSFIMNCLRGAGFGASKSSEDKILEQANQLNDYLETLSKGGKEIYFRDILPKATINVIFQILYSKRYEYDDPELQNILDTLRDWFDCFGDAFFLDKVPKLIIKIFYSGLVASILEKSDRIRRIIRKEIDIHLETFDPENPRDFVDAYLAKKGRDCVDKAVDNALVYTTDAADTLAMAIEWLFLYLTHRQDVQKKVCDEIEVVTGGNRLVCWADRSKLPYTEATIREVIRISTLIPKSSPHAVSEDTLFRGYRIPKSAYVYASLYSAHRDPSKFRDPDEFRPERFLDTDGTLIKSDTWIPFSMGRRKCPGEQIAQIEFFLFTTNLLQKFHMKFPSGQQPPLEPSQRSFIRKPHRFPVVLSNR